MSEKRCKLCNKPYERHYSLFGRGCLENVYELLSFSKPPKVVWNKEMKKQQVGKLEFMI